MLKISPTKANWPYRFKRIKQVSYRTAGWRQIITPSATRVGMFRTNDWPMLNDFGNRAAVRRPYKGFFNFRHEMLRGPSLWMQREPFHPGAYDFDLGLRPWGALNKGWLLHRFKTLMRMSHGVCDKYTRPF